MQRRIIQSIFFITGSNVFVFSNDTFKDLWKWSDKPLRAKYLNKNPVLTSESIVEILAGKPVVVIDINTTNLLQYPDHARQEKIGAIVSIPILLSEKVIRAIRLYHSETWNVSDKDIDSLLMLGEMIGLAMMYSRMPNSCQESEGNYRRNISCLARRAGNEIPESCIVLVYG